MTTILSLHSSHDAAAAVFQDYRLVAAVQQERLSRRKNDNNYPREAAAEALRIAGIESGDVDQIVLSHGIFPSRWIKFSGLRTLRHRFHHLRGREHRKNIFREMQKRDVTGADIWLNDTFLADEGFRPDTPIYFSDHHTAHAVASLFFAPPWENALAYTSDGIGDGIHYSARILKDGALTCLFGEQPDLGAASLGRAYSICTQLCGFRKLRHEGKLTGLAAFGEPDLADDMAALFRVEEDGRIMLAPGTDPNMMPAFRQICEGHSRETIAASVQKVLEDIKVDVFRRLIERNGISHLALGGGVFANVRLNARLAELPGVKEIFIFPAMGDEGLAVGGILQFLLERDGLSTWLDQRYRLDDAYLGGADADADTVFSRGQNIVTETGEAGGVAKHAAALLESGLVGAIFTGRMEYGPRALGARSIIASPADGGVNQTINERLNRTEFMPFAPYVLAEDAEDVFEIDDRNRYACRFMTITTPVREKWNDRIPAVVHVDGTARPQIIERDQNPLYADILSEWKARTGLPVLVNTSFNAHEEPIINTAKEALTALLNDRVDFLVTEKAIYRKAGAA